jgi:hypothetical protein
LASMALADHPRVLLPIIFYNLVQHLVAGGFDFVLSRNEGERRLAHNLQREAASPRPEVSVMRINAGQDKVGSRSRTSGVGQT